MNSFNLHLTAIRKYQLICVLLSIGITGLLIVNSLVTNLTLTKINTAKQQLQTENLSRQANRDQNEFFQTQTDVIAAIDQALPGQNDLVGLVEEIESLQTPDLTGFDFGFSALVPMLESNQYYLPFNLRINAPLPAIIDFLRRFEKVPYLAKINSLTAKTPNGLSGILEVTISGKIYVQDNFKN